ncbi:hypothetical protein [Glycomyces xiaoerkulensis]|nr:hypothetical protein [Glycomyces xiaoerkulensis]
MAHRREPEGSRGPRVRTWTIGAVILVALAAVVVLASLAVRP